MFGIKNEKESKYALRKAEGALNDFCKEINDINSIFEKDCSLKGWYTKRRCL